MIMQIPPSMSSHGCEGALNRANSDTFDNVIVWRWPSYLFNVHINVSLSREPPLIAVSVEVPQRLRGHFDEVDVLLPISDHCGGIEAFPSYCMEAVYYPGDLISFPPSCIVQYGRFFIGCSIQLDDLSWSHGSPLFGLCGRHPPLSVEPLEGPF